MIRERLSSFAAPLVAWVVICGSLYAAVPKYHGMYQGLGWEYPMPTQLLMDMFVSFSRTIIVLAVGVIFILAAALKVPIARCRMVAMGVLLGLAMFAALCPLVIVLPTMNLMNIKKVE